MFNKKFTEEHIWRGQLIDAFVKKYDYKSYLEIGFLNGLTFNLVTCASKVGVDPYPRVYDPRVVTKTSDNFFAKNTNKFDIVFIDGDHEKHQVYKDFKNSYNCLNENGVIIFHDINPLSRQGTALTGHGDCFETWINMYNHYKLYTYSTKDDTVGIFIKKLNPLFVDFNFKNYDYEELNINRQKYIFDLQINDELNF